MKKILSAMVVMGCLLPAVKVMADSTATSQPATTQAQAMENLDTKIAAAIELLEAKKLAETIRLLADPVFVKKVEDAGDFPKLVASFEKDNKAGELLKALKAAATQKPTYTDDGKVANYKVPTSTSPDLVFVAVGGKWYLR